MMGRKRIPRSLREEKRTAHPVGKQSGTFKTKHAAPYHGIPRSCCWAFTPEMNASSHRHTAHGLMEAVFVTAPTWETAGVARGANGQTACAAPTPRDTTGPRGGMKPRGGLC